MGREVQSPLFGDPIFEILLISFVNCNFQTNQKGCLNTIDTVLKPTLNGDSNQGKKDELI